VRDETQYTSFAFLLGLGILPGRWCRCMGAAKEWWNKTPTYTQNGQVTLEGADGVK
jgi:hypothetical protein